MKIIGNSSAAGLTSQKQSNLGLQVGFEGQRLSWIGSGWRNYILGRLGSEEASIFIS